MDGILTFIRFRIHYKFHSPQKSAMFQILIERTDGAVVHEGNENRA